jgi:membrane protein DedA with SNARE-associated domain
MSGDEMIGPLAYLGVFMATVLEGEAVFLAAAVLAQAGRLDPLCVFAAAALGGSAGDQLYFYALRGRPGRWLDRLPAWARRRDCVTRCVARHATAIILACRFLPSLRVAIPAACALSGVSPLRFSLLSFVSSLAWAGSVISVVAWVGPASLARLGVEAWWAPIVPAAALLLISGWLASKTRRVAATPISASAVLFGRRPPTHSS